jgi:nitrite reductase (NO-forming)
VVDSHRLTTRLFATAAGFGIFAAAWSIRIALSGGTWWGPIHTFLAGAVLAAISGATQLFTITWSAASAPRPSLSWLQQGSLIGGVTAVLIGVTSGIEWLVWAGGAALAGSLALLATMLVGVVRRSLLRRFDLSSRFYLLALGCGVTGVTLGTLLATGTLGAHYPTARQVHLHLNVIGLVGFTIIGTIPTLLVTFAHRGIVSGREAAAAWWMCLGSAILIAAGLWTTDSVVGIGALLAAAAFVVVTAGIALRLGSVGWSAGLSYWQVILGIGWLTAWMVIDGIGLIARSPLSNFATVTAAAITVGIGQVLAGSLAYLIPVLLGSSGTSNLVRMTRWPAVPLVAANALGVLLITGVGPAVALAAATWGADFARRVLGLRSHRTLEGKSEPDPTTES